ncbi:MAG: DUF3108 domain-containing protein [Bdellovibrionales bacterium]|nr:DUF3108 domain-containing protein [Bdellovibrionales bacterium]
MCVLLSGCAGHVLQHDKADKVLKVDEYDQKVDVKEEEPSSTATAAADPETTKSEPTTGKESAKNGSKDKQKKTGKGKAALEKEKVKPKGPRQPEIEDTVGFDGRRPLVDPFRVGEKVTLNLSYFNIVAGTMDIEVKPFAKVNGQKAYHFEVAAKSNSFFNRIYAVDDKATTYMSYDEMVPFNLVISIKESKQLAETRTLFDLKNNTANYWKKRITSDDKEESKKLEWKIAAYSQNVISAAYYLRTFKMEPGKKLAFRVADEGKNIVFTGEVIKREVLNTDIGKLNTVLIVPQLTVDGVFTPVGEIKMWLTDDDRKFIVRMESKIKIGTVVAKLKSIEKGAE